MSGVPETWLISLNIVHVCQPWLVLVIARKVFAAAIEQAISWPKYACNFPHAIGHLFHAGDVPVVAVFPLVNSSHVIYPSVTVLAGESGQLWLQLRATS
jgi:hypothetical protein